MRVVYVSTLALGGPVTHLQQLAVDVQGAGADVLVVCGTADVAEDFRARDVEAVVLPVRHKLDLAGAARLWPYLRRADVVHTHDRRAGLLARPQACALGAGAVHTMHGIPDEIFVEVGRTSNGSPAHASRARLAWLRHGLLGIEATLARLGVVVVPSHALAEYLAAHGFPRERMRVIPNGVKVQRTEPGAIRSPLVVGTAAVLDERKGIDVLIRACSLIGVPVRLEVFGTGAQEPFLRQLAEELQVDVTLHGHVRDLRERLLDLDVFALPSRAENLPMAVIEAMAAALPVVATRVGGIPEAVEDGVTGILVEPDDPAGLATALARLAAAPGLAHDLGAAGARRAAECFDATRLARQVLDLYEGLCASSR